MKLYRSQAKALLVLLCFFISSAAYAVLPVVKTTVIRDVFGHRLLFIVFSFFALCLSNATAHAQSQNEVQVTVLFDGLRRPLP